MTGTRTTAEIIEMASAEQPAAGRPPSPVSDRDRAHHGRKRRGRRKTTSVCVPRGGRHWLTNKKPAVADRPAGNPRTASSIKAKRPHLDGIGTGLAQQSTNVGTRLGRRVESVVRPGGEGRPTGWTGVFRRRRTTVGAPIDVGPEAAARAR